jgi:hypothetical protein
MRRRRRNFGLDTTTLLLLGGAGVLGYILYQRFAAPGAASQAALPSSNLGTTPFFKFASSPAYTSSDATSPSSSGASNASTILAAQAAYQGAVAGNAALAEED